MSAWKPSESWLVSRGRSPTRVLVHTRPEVDRNPPVIRLTEGRPQPRPTPEMAMPAVMIRADGRTPGALDARPGARPWRYSVGSGISRIQQAQQREPRRALLHALLEDDVLTTSGGRSSDRPNSRPSSPQHRRQLLPHRRSHTITPPRRPHVCPTAPTPAGATSPFPTVP